MRNDCRPDYNKRLINYPPPISDKIVLTSKSRLDTKAPERRPVKECYCFSEVPEKNQPAHGPEGKKSSSRNQTGELVELYCSRNAETGRNSLVATLLGCETLRRAGRITYLPNSEFLRRVQKKVYCHRRKKPMGVCSHLSSSPSSEECGEITSKETCAAKLGHSKEENGRKGEKIDSEKNRGPEPLEGKKSARGGKAEAPKRPSRSHSQGSSPKSQGNEKKMQRAHEPKTKAKVGTKKVERTAGSVNAERPKSRKIVRTISAHSRCCNPKKEAKSSKTENSESGKKQSEKAGIEFSGNCNCETRRYAEMSGENRWQLSRDRDHSRTGESEERVRELSKFRRANYFETHGSVDTLVGSSRSSMVTIDPCEFNDRFFAASHSSGRNVKRIHYYPSYVVREERLTDDTSSRKKIRPRSSDLVGHVVDLGILKIPCDFSNNVFLNCHRRRSDDEGRE